MNYAKTVFRTVFHTLLSTSAIALYLSSLSPGYADEPPRDVLPPAPGGSRPIGAPCLIAPHYPEMVVWSDRPLFIWQGEAMAIALRLPGSAAPFWQKSVTGMTQFHYDGAALQPGQIYEWLVYGPASEQPLMIRVFQVMPDGERQAIAAELDQLTAQLTAQLTTQEPNETIAIARVNALIDQGLWADAIQELFSIPQPSAAIAQYQQAITTHLCNSES
ncbi:MAG TPA: hypothetical protein V6C88_07525 [Chroococcidiopsis sp.]